MTGELDCIVSADNKEIVSLQAILEKNLIPDKWYSSQEIGLIIKCKSNKWKLANSDKAETILTEINRKFNGRK